MSNKLDVKLDDDFSRFATTRTQYVGVTKCRMFRSRIVYEVRLTDNRISNRLKRTLLAKFDNIHDAAKQYDIWRIMLGLKPVNILRSKAEV